MTRLEDQTHNLPVSEWTLCHETTQPAEVVSEPHCDLIKRAKDGLFAFPWLEKSIGEVTF